MTIHRIPVHAVLMTNQNPTMGEVGCTLVLVASQDEESVNLVHDETIMEMRTVLADGRLPIAAVDGILDGIKSIRKVTGVLVVNEGESAEPTDAAE